MIRYLITKKHTLDRFIETLDSDYCSSVTVNAYNIDGIHTVDHVARIEYGKTCIFTSTDAYEKEIPVGTYKYKLYTIKNGIRVASYANGLDVVEFVEESTHKEVELSLIGCSQEFQKLMSDAILIPERFSNNYSLENCVAHNKKKIVIEGSDYAGKTYLCKKLIEEYGCFVQERDLANVSYLIRNYLGLNKVIRNIRSNLIDQKDTEYIILTTTPEIIQARAIDRLNRNRLNRISKWDTIAQESNEIYVEVFDNIKLNNAHVVHVDKKSEDSFDQAKHILFSKGAVLCKSE